MAMTRLRNGWVPPAPPPPVVCRCGEMVQYRSDRTSGFWYHSDGARRCSDGGVGGPR